MMTKMTHPNDPINAPRIPDNDGRSTMLIGLQIIPPKHQTLTYTHGVGDNLWFQTMQIQQ